MYRIGIRGTRLNKEGKEVVLTPEQLQLAKEIKDDFPIIEKVYDEYQEYNNAILDYAVQTGILSEEITINQLIENITSTTKKIKKKQLEKLRNEARENGFTDEQFRQELLTLANDTNLNLPEGKKIDIRGTAEIWRDNSDYYPFYRKMADDTIQGPAVAGGFLSGNPLGIEIKGSKKFKKNIIRINKRSIKFYNKLIDYIRKNPNIPVHKGFKSYYHYLANNDEEKIKKLKEFVQDV